MLIFYAGSLIVFCMCFHILSTKTSKQKCPLILKGFKVKAQDEV